MAKYTINDTTLTAIADAIREKSGTTGGIDPANMAALIAAIEAGGGISGYDVACGMFVPAENIARPVVDTGWGEAPDLTKRVGVACIGFQPADTPNEYRNLAFVEALNANINQSVNSYRVYAYMNATATTPSIGNAKNFAQGANSCKYNSDGTIQLCGYTTAWHFAAGHIYIWFAVKEQ